MVRSITIGAFAFYGTWALVCLYRGSSPRAEEVVGSVLGFGAVCAVVWAHRHFKGLPK